MGWLTETFNRTERDDHAQPLNPMFCSHGVQTRQIDELIGLIKGVLADGVIYQSEIEFLLKWMQANQSTANEWPAKVLYPRICAALADGHMDADEENEIMSLLLATVGDSHLPATGESSNSTSLPFTQPTPSIEFTGNLFCFTGKFNSGTRNWCEQQVHDRGGLSVESVTKKLSYLVIGEIGSRDWLHSTYGTKIQKAVEYRDSGATLSIISEKHWYERISA